MLNRWCVKFKINLWGGSLSDLVFYVIYKGNIFRILIIRSNLLKLKFELLFYVEKVW